MSVPVVVPDCVPSRLSKKGPVRVGALSNSHSHAVLREFAGAEATNLGKAMLKSSSFAFVGVVGVLVMVAACATSNSGDEHGGSSASGGNGASGGTVNLGGNGATNVGGLGNGGQPPIPMVACAGDMPCADGEICAGGFCAPDLGPCSDDDDCDGDSYCCGEGCRDDGGEPVCIPYGYGPRGTLNPECKGEPPEIGVFSPSVQCEWLGPGADDPYPDSKYVLSTPLVADLPNDSGAAAEIVVITYAGTDGSSSAPGVIRILNGQTCALLESIYDETDIVRANATAALADLDNDGTVEIVARGNVGGAVAFSWDGSAFVKTWANSTPAVGGKGQNWDGPSIHDLDDDGLPEVLVEASVYNGQTGELLYDGSPLMGTKPFNGMIPIAGDFEGDGVVELLYPDIPHITYFGWSGSAWTEKGPLMEYMGTHYAIADFGTVGAAPADFDFGNLDGIAEIVAVVDETGLVTIHALDGQRVFELNTADRGGPPTIADFDADGFPEVSIAGETRIRVFDPDCVGAPAGCESEGVRWSQPTQDASSAQTGVAVFDFEGDGKAEVVYADECFLRVYDGTSGEVLYSAYRTSGTWYESPVVADVDRDQNTEIVVNNAYYVACGDTPSMPFVDPIHRGVRCDDDAGCIPGGNCVDGYCRCADSNDCDSGMTCATPIDGTPGTGDVCRATHPNSAEAAGGIRVLRDRLDRWVSSRSIWNQHAYSITNVNDDGTIPRTSDVLLNWQQPGLNNFRQNVQGDTGYSDFPDITGALSQDNVCVVDSSGEVTLTATVCNRGAKAVGADMPATFYQGDPADGAILCVSYTQGPVPVQGCMDVSCTIDAEITGEITMVVNDNGGGGQTTVECNSENNTDSVLIESCAVK